MTTKISMDDLQVQLIALTVQLLSESGEPYKRDVQLQDSLQRHLGIDSLGRAELFQRIEKQFGVVLPERLLAEAETLGDVAYYIQNAEPTLLTPATRTITTSHGDRVSVDPSSVHSLVDLLLLYAEKSPAKPHIYFQHENGQEEVVTYGDLLTKASQVAYQLRARGLQNGETVAIMQPTHPFFFYTFFGVLLAGGIPVPIYPPFRMHMLEAYAKTEARILKNAEVRVLVTFEEAEKLSRLLQAFVPSLKVVVTARELLQSNEIIKNPHHGKSDTFALIQYTSGSTNDPKGVLLTNANLLANIRAYGKAIRITSDDVAVSWLPLYHDMGLIGAWFGSLYHGIPLILMTPFSFLSHPERWLWAIHYHRGTITGAPNFAYELCVRKLEPQQLEGLDLSSWRVAANGAEKVYPRTLEQFNDKFARYGLKQNVLTPMYGLAESTVGLTIPPIDRVFHVDYVSRRQFEEEQRAIPIQNQHELAYVSCGMPIEGHEVRIVDDQGRVLSERHVGSLQFRGPSSMQGYYHNAVATQAIYHDGWLDSGDLGYLADGELYITGRRKDLIIKAGRNLYPAEIEELVGQVEGVRQGCVAAFGVTHTERGTEQLIIVAETREKNKHKRSQIIQAVNEAIATTLDMTADAVMLVSPHTVPKTSSGKLQRAACKTMYLEGRLGQWHLPPWLQMVKLGVEMGLRKVRDAIVTTARIIYTAYVVAWLLMSVPLVYLLICFTSADRARQICRLWARGIIMATFNRLKVKHRDNLTKTSPVIFALNHASYVDAIVALAVTPDNARFVGKKELLAAPIIRTFMRKLRVITVDRLDLSKGLDDAKHMEEALRAGDSIIIFPEGTFGYASGLRPFRLGAFKIAAAARVPVCPVALRGTRTILRDDEKCLSPGQVVVTVCKPIMPQGVEWQDVTLLRHAVRAEIAKYCGEASLDYIAAQTIAPKFTEHKEL